MDASQLKSMTLFEGVADDAIERWAGCFQETELLAGAGLTREGDFAYKFFIVLDGEVEVLRDFEHLATLGPGDFFGEMGILNDARRNARIVANSRCRVAWMMGWDFETMTRETPEIAAKIERAIEARGSS